MIPSLVLYGLGVVALIYISFCKNDILWEDNAMRTKLSLFISLACIIVSIILMLLPIGAVLTFAPNPTDRITKTFSYFDMIVFGYGNIFPLLTAILSMFLLILVSWTLFNCKYSRKREMIMNVCSVICVFTSALSLMLFSQISIIGIAILILIFISTALQFFFFSHGLNFTN